MSDVRLVLEHTPTPQAQTEVTFRGGQLVVGRGDDVDWRIDDPDQFVSRKHFVISSEGDAPKITDASSGGLYVDGATQSLGAGNSVLLEDGMRLRFGDFVARIEMPPRSETAAEPHKKSSPFAFEFDPVEDETPQPKRPDDLPEPFQKRSSRFFSDDPAENRKPPEPVDRDSPFVLGLKPGIPDAEEPPKGGYFLSEPDGQPERQIDVEDVPKDEKPKKMLSAEPDAELRAAFYRGLGLNPDEFTSDNPVAEMEALGKRFRALTDGLTHLLKTRAEERQRVRIAHTIVGSSNVNALKFAVGADEAVSSLVAERGSGYLDPDASIAEAYRDLIDHQMRTWSALQTALRRMIDKFDPEEVEREMEDTGLLEALIAGGRSAKLWQLYRDRYQDIARSAEERFLGEIGADFRDAYER